MVAIFSTVEHLTVFSYTHLTRIETFELFKFSTNRTGARVIDYLVMISKAKMPLSSNDDDNHSEEIASSPGHPLAQCLSAMAQDAATIVPSLVASDSSVGFEAHLVNQQLCFRD